MASFSQPAVISTSAQVAAGSIETTDLVDDAVTVAKQAHGTAGALRSFAADTSPGEITPGTSGLFLMSNGAGAVPTYETAGKDWEQLGETILSVDATSISVASFAARKDLMVIIHGRGKDVESSGDFIRFNSDSGANYSFVIIRNGVAEAADVSQTEIDLHDSGGSGTGPTYIVMHINNDAAAFRKFGIYTYIEVPANAAAGGTRLDGHYLWNNTSAQITTIAYIMGSNKLLAGTRMTVYGKKN